MLAMCTFENLAGSQPAEALEVFGSEASKSDYLMKKLVGDKATVVPHKDANPSVEVPREANARHLDETPRRAESAPTAQM